MAAGLSTASVPAAVMDNPTPISSDRKDASSHE